MSNSRNLWSRRLQEIDARIEEDRATGRTIDPDLIKRRRELRRRLNRLDRFEEQKRMQRVRVRPAD